MGLLILVSIYLLMALLFHQVKIEQSQKKRFVILSIEQKYKVLSKYTCITIGFFSILRQCSSFTELWTNFYIANYNLTLSQEAVMASACKVLTPHSNFALTIGTGLVFLFLWFRQRIIFIHPSLKILSNKCLKIFSFGIIAGWLLLYVAGLPAYFILVRYYYKRKLGCTIEEKSVSFHNLINIAWLVVSILMQLSLLFLFVYPILKRTAWRSQQSSKHRSTALIRKVKKAIVLTSIAFGTDIVTILIDRLFSEETMSNFVFDFGVNLIINHLVTIACFDNWKELLWPWTLQSKALF